MRDEFIAYGEQHLGCKAERTFAKYPNYVALRHPVSNKWAAMVMDIPRRCIGLSGDEIIDVVNVKLDPAMVAALRGEEGYAPAWHMNKEHWLTVRLDGSVPFEKLCALLEMSCDLVG